MAVDDVGISVVAVEVVAVLLDVTEDVAGMEAPGVDVEVTVVVGEEFATVSVLMVVAVDVTSLVLPEEMFIMVELVIEKEVVLAEFTVLIDVFAVDVIVEGEIILVKVALEVASVIVVEVFTLVVGVFPIESLFVVVLAGAD